MTKEIKIGKVTIGGSAPIAIQSMTNLSAVNIDGTLRQIAELEQVGCDIIRIAVPNVQSVEAFKVIKKNTSTPLVADIHFDGKLAISAIEAGADKIRINPGNMAYRQLDAVIDCARNNSVPIRLGVNGGSVNKDLLKSCNGNRELAIEKNLVEYVKYFENRKFDNLVLSVKSSDVIEMVSINRRIAQLPYPIHLGVTEAGLSYQGLVKNSIGIGSLLLDGIGNTIRVSLTASPIEEVRAAKEILRALNKYDGVKFVSCPQCGRCRVRLEEIAREIYDYVQSIKSNIKIAVMGCEVNGPGECRDADLGIAGANGKFVFFKNGVIYKTVDEEIAVEEFKREIDIAVK